LRDWLPFLARIGAPLALGGTSNYSRREALEAAGGWDAWDVREDADIGLRLARLGYRAPMIDPPCGRRSSGEDDAMARPADTLDEEPSADVAGAEPQSGERGAGMGVSNYLLTPVTLHGSLLAAMAWILASAVAMAWVEVWHVVLFGLGYGSALVAALVTRAPSLKPAALLTLSLTLSLHSVAMARALCEMKRRPHIWAKTPHHARRPGFAVASAPALAAADNVVQLPLPL